MITNNLKIMNFYPDKKIAVEMNCKRYAISETESDKFTDFFDEISDVEKQQMLDRIFNRPRYETKLNEMEGAQFKNLKAVIYLKWQEYKQKQGLVFESSEKSEMILNNIKKGYSKYV